MFGNLKKMLGIEDVKISLLVPVSIEESVGEINGTVKLTSYKDSSIDSISIKLIEKYSRGRSDNKLIDEYVVGSIELVDHIDIQKEEIIEIPFTLPYTLSKSAMDQYESKNIFFKGLVKVAKTFKGVKSEYKIQAEAFVSGTKFHPLDTKNIIIK